MIQTHRDYPRWHTKVNSFRYFVSPRSGKHHLNPTSLYLFHLWCVTPPSPRDTMKLLSFSNSTLIHVLEFTSHPTRRICKSFLARVNHAEIISTLYLNFCSICPGPTNQCRQTHLTVYVRPIKYIRPMMHDTTTVAPIYIGAKTRRAIRNPFFAQV